MIPIGKLKQTVVEHLKDMLADPLCLDEMTGYQEKAVKKVIALLDGIDIGRLEAICDAERDGRLVVLPCKVGTRVWVIGQDCDLCHDMYTEEPCLFGDCEYRKVIESVFLPGMTDEFGKTVFLTREEAEKALQEGSE